MRFEEVEEQLSAFGYTALTAPAAGELLYRLLLETDAEDVLELGFAHGTSTMYLAAALQERGAGVVTTIDRAGALDQRPNLRELAAALGVEEYVMPVLATRSYNWELRRLIQDRSHESRTTPCFDFCFVDGAHTWYDDGLAFFLVDKLLRQDRWILFDDVHWTSGSSPSKQTGSLLSLPEEERNTAQVSDVFELLVRQHPSYGEFRLLGNYAAAYKVGSEGKETNRDAFDRALSRESAHELAFAAMTDAWRRHADRS